MRDWVRVEYMPTEGPRGEVTLQVPRVVDGRTGEVLLSLWGSWFQGPIEWSAPGVLRMHMLRVASGGFITIDLDVDARTYRVVAEELASEHDQAFIRKAFAASPFQRAPRLAPAPVAAAADVLAALRGEWTGVYRLWLEPGDLRADCPSTLRAEPVLDGRFVSLAYTWEVDGGPQAGQMLLGPGPQMAWVDPWHNGGSIMFSEAVAGSDGDEGGFNVVGSYGPADAPWGWRTTVEVPEPDVVVVTMWNIPPDGAEAKAVEAAYTR